MACPCFVTSFLQIEKIEYELPYFGPYMAEMVTRIALCNPSADPIFSLSPLAIHTRNLLADPRCTLVVQVPPTRLFSFLSHDLLVLLSSISSCHFFASIKFSSIWVAMWPLLGPIYIHVYQVEGWIQTKIHVSDLYSALTGIPFGSNLHVP